MMTLKKAREYLPPGVEISDEELTALLAENYAIANLAADIVLNSKRDSKKEKA